MAKEKASENSKKSNNSASKGKQSALSKLIQNLTEKVVAPNKPENKAKSVAPKAPKAATKPAAKPVKEKPSTLSSTAHEVPVTPPVPAPVSGAAQASTANDDIEVVLTDAEGRRYCRAMDCDQIGIVDGYCRYHYLYFWKKIQVRKKILADGKLERYIEELTSRYVDKFIELLRKDTRTEKDFLAAVQELELDDSASSSQADDDEAKTYLEEISGVATESSSRDDDGY